MATSDKMIMLWDPEYFDRLWCCAEVAIFCSSKGGPTEVEFAARPKLSCKVLSRSKKALKQPCACGLHRKDRCSLSVPEVPLWVAPWVLSTILTQLLCISISERLFSLPLGRESNWMRSASNFLRVAGNRVLLEECAVLI